MKKFILFIQLLFSSLIFSQNNTKINCTYSGSIIKKSIIIGKICLNKENTENINSKINVDFFDKSIRIYPNPTKDLIYIENPDNKIIKNLSLYNIDGKLISIYLYFDNYLDLSNLPTGLYFLNFNVDNNIITNKIIKF